MIPKRAFQENQWSRWGSRDLEMGLVLCKEQVCCCHWMIMQSVEQAAADVWQQLINSYILFQRNIEVPHCMNTK